MRKIIFAILSSLFSIALHAQDITYYDNKDKVVKISALANYYKETRPDSVNPKWTRELTYYKSGKIKSDAVLNQWKKNSVTTKYERTYKEWYESGKLHKIIEFSDGKLNGKALSYWENGNLKHEGIYENEKPIKGKNFNSDGSKNQDGPYRCPAEYPGGVAKMMQFLSKNIRYPAIAQEDNKQGIVVLKYIVDKEGNISNIQVLHKIGSGCDEEAIRVVKLMPRWTPGKQDGEPVDVDFTLPIKFTIK